MINKKRVERSLALSAIVVIVISWFIGVHLKDADVVSSIREKIPEIAKLEEIEKGTFKIYNSQKEHLGYVTIESSMGYGGPLQMAVAVDKKGNIFDLAVISSKETPSYLEKVLKANYLDNIIGKSYNDEYSIGKGIDAISSATYTSRAVVEASKNGNRFIAANVLGFDVPVRERASIQFGFPEFVLLLLFAIGYFAHKKTFRYTKIARWVTMLTGLLVVGFYYNQPFSLSMINQLLLGYLPPLHSHLYWYLLLGGIFIVLTIDNKNPYCQWFCPFGAAQECMGLVGGAKVRKTGKLKNVFKWALRVFVLSAIVTSLITRNPGVASYEVFGTLFKLTGSNVQFAILAMVLVSSIFIKRPWCNYLCPVAPVLNHYSYVRRLIMDRWRGKKSNPKEDPKSKEKKTLITQKII